MRFVTEPYLLPAAVKSILTVMGRFILLAAVVLMCSCTSSTKRSGTGRVITVSIVPQKAFVQKIAGNDFEINILAPPGTSPETGSLLPSQLKNIAGSDLWFRMGYLEIEYAWQDKIAQANPNMKIVDLSEGLDLITESHEHGKKVHEGGVDPHTWLSPTMVKQMAEKITEELALVNPDRADVYNLNCLEFAKEIDRLDYDIKNLLREYQGRKIVIFHPSLSYFTRDYGLVQYSLETGGKEPTPQTMAEVVRMAKAENIKVIYVQSDFDQDNATVFAEEMKGRVIVLDLLSQEWEQNLRLMTQTFVDNF